MFKPFLLGFETRKLMPVKRRKASCSNRSFWDLKPGTAFEGTAVQAGFKPFLLGFETPFGAGRPQPNFHPFKPFLLGFETFYAPEYGTDLRACSNRSFWDLKQALDWALSRGMRGSNRSFWDLKRRPLGRPRRVTFEVQTVPSGI